MHPPTLTGNTGDERKYLFKKTLDACVPVPGKKAKFAYLVCGAHVCTQAFCIALGLHPTNGRVRHYQTMVRRGVRSLVPVKRKLNPATRTNDAKAFIRRYILIHSQFPPNTPTAHVDFAGHEALYEAYAKSTVDPLLPSYVKTLWPVVLSEKIYDPDVSRLELVRFTTPP